MNKNDLRRYGWIGVGVLVMVLLVVIPGHGLWPEGSSLRVKSFFGGTVRKARAYESPLQEGKLPFVYRDWTANVPPTLTGNRTLETYYDRRQYPGAPPVIPHPVLGEFKSDDEDRCQSCHSKGGYVKAYQSYAPVTPHLELPACRQCHVPQTTTEQFRRTRWKSVRPPKLGRSALGGSPPPIPHRLQMRRNCHDCHAGPGAVKALRSDHPERTYCVQCHVPQNTDKRWKRSKSE